LADLRSTYVMLKAIGKREEIEGCDTFAMVAPQGRVVVDRSSFQEQVARKIRWGRGWMEEAAYKGEEIDGAVFAESMWRFGLGTKWIRHWRGSRFVVSFCNRPF
jgi:hypothetical protein